MATDDSSSKYVLLDQLAEEFAARYRRGERPNLQEYIDRHPELADDIRDLFPAMAQIEQAKEDGQATAPLPLDQIGDFRIIREIGRGGMGVVYEAEQLSLGRRVALKVLPGNSSLSPSMKHRFEREARAAAKLHHTNIVPVFGVGEHDGVPYFAMQYIRGLGLDAVLAELQRIRRGMSLPAGGPAPPKLSAAAVARWLLTGVYQPEEADAPEDSDADPAEAATIIQTASAAPVAAEPATIIQTASAAPVAAEPVADSEPPSSADSLSSSSSSLLGSGSHADGAGRPGGQTYWQRVAAIGTQIADALSYAHGKGILHRDVKPSNLLLDSRGTIWIADFGLAKVEGQQNLTHTGDIIGTLCYMPPEAFSGKTDARSDIYSTGLTLYELLTLRPAFAGLDRVELVSRIALDEPARPRSLDKKIPADLETIVLKAIDKNPAHRYQAAAELADDLRRFVADEPIKARRMTPAERLWRWCKHHKSVAALSAAVAVLLVATAVGGSVAALRFARLAEREAAARAEAEANYQQARRVVDDNLTRVSESGLLRAPGMQPLRKELLGLALQYYQGFLQQRGDEPALRGDLAEVYARTARITAEIGSRAEAIRLQEKGLEMRRRLRQESPDDRALALRLVDDYLTLSALHRQTDDPAAARRAYRDAYQLLLAVSPQERRRDGEVALSNGHTILDITAHRSDDPEVLRRFADALLEAATVEAGAGDRMQAVVKVFQSVCAQQGLIKQCPGESPQFRAEQGLAGRWLLLGGLHAELGLHEWALTFAEEAKAVLGRLLREHPAGEDVTDVRRELAAADATIGSLHARAGRLPEAARAYAEALLRRRKLADENPAVTDFQADLTRTLLSSGEARARAGDTAGALRDLLDGLGRQQAHARANAGERSHARDLARYHLALAKVYRLSGQPDQESAAYGAARQALEGLPPGAAEDWYLLAIARAGCAAASPGLAAGVVAAGPAGTLGSVAALLRTTPDLDRSADALREAVSAGFRDRDRLAAEEELAPLRWRPDYREAAERIDEKRKNPLWEKDFEAAKARAAREKKDLLVYFCSTDDDALSPVLREKYLDAPATSRALAAEWVAVALDNPRYRPKPPDQAVYTALRERWNVRFFTDVVLADAKGRAFARLHTGDPIEENWTPEYFVDRLGKLRTIRVRRDDLFAQAAAGGAAQAAALDRALDVVAPEFVGEYTAEFGDIIRDDAGDAAGLRSKYLGLAGERATVGAGQATGPHDAWTTVWELMRPAPRGEIRRLRTDGWRSELAWIGEAPWLFAPDLDGTIKLMEPGRRVREQGYSRPAPGGAVGDRSALHRSWNEPFVHRFVGHKGTIWGLAVSEDGARVLTCGVDGTVRLWERETGRELRRWAVPNCAWVQVGFAPDGRHAACGAADGTARLFDLTADRPPTPLPGPPGGAWAVAFSADSRYVMTGGTDRTLRVWEADTGRKVRQWEGMTPQLVRLAVSRDGRRLLACGSDATVEMWDYESRRRLWQARPGTQFNDANVGAFAADGRHCLTGNKNMLVLWETETGRPALQFRAPGKIVGVAMAPDGRHAVTCEQGGVYRIYPLTEDAARAAELMHTGPSDRAIEAWDKVVDAEPGEPGCYLARAQLYARREQWDKVAADVAAAGRLDPADPAATAAANKLADLLADKAHIWNVLQPGEVRSAAGATLTLLRDGSVLAGGNNAVGEVYSLTAKTTGKGITAFRLEVLPDASLPDGGPGRAPDGTFILTRFTVEANGKPLQWSRVTASFSQRGFPADSLAGNGPGYWAILPQAATANYAVFFLKKPLGEGEALDLDIHVCCESYLAQRNIGRFRLAYAVGSAESDPLARTAALPGNAWKRLAAACALSGMWQPSLHALEAAAVDSPCTDAATRFLQAIAYGKLGQRENAWRAYGLAKEAMSRAAANPEVLKLAFAAASEAIWNGPADIDLKTELARWQARLGNANGAITDLPAGPDPDPSALLEAGDAPGLLQLADQLAARGDWEMASHCFARSLELSDGTPFDWYRHALLRLYLGDGAGYRRIRAAVLARFGDARDCDAGFVNLTCELAPYNPDCDLSQLLTTAEKPTPSNPPGYLSARLLGTAYFRAGMYAAAIDELERARQLRDSPLVWLFLAMAHRQAGHTAEAKAWLARAQNYLDRAQQSPDAAVGEQPAWNLFPWMERLRFQLFRREAERELSREGRAGE
jgi:serine/threonine protein kinase/WD40 repeat protein